MTAATPVDTESAMTVTLVVLSEEERAEAQLARKAQIARALRAADAKAAEPPLSRRQRLVAGITSALNPASSAVTAAREPLPFSEVDVDTAPAFDRVMQAKFFRTALRDGWQYTLFTTVDELQKFSLELPPGRYERPVEAAPTDLVSPEAPTTDLVLITIAECEAARLQAFAYWSDKGGAPVLPVPLLVMGQGWLTTLPPDQSGVCKEFGRAENVRSKTKAAGYEDPPIDGTFYAVPAEEKQFAIKQCVNAWLYGMKPTEFSICLATAGSMTLETYGLVRFVDQTTVVEYQDMTERFRQRNYHNVYSELVATALPLPKDLCQLELVPKAGLSGGSSALARTASFTPTR